MRASWIRFSLVCTIVLAISKLQRRAICKSRPARSCLSKKIPQKVVLATAVASSGVLRIVKGCWWRQKKQLLASFDVDRALARSTSIRARECAAGACVRLRGWGVQCPGVVQWTVCLCVVQTRRKMCNRVSIQEIQYVGMTSSTTVTSDSELDEQSPEPVSSFSHEWPATTITRSYCKVFARRIFGLVLYIRTTIWNKYKLVIL